MANFIVKVQEMRQKINDEINSFKNCHHDHIDETDETITKNLDDLFFKVNNEIDQLENGIISFVSEEDSKSILETRTVTILTKLMEIITQEFHAATDDLLFGSKNLDTFIFNVGYQIDQMKSDILAPKTEEIDGYTDIENRKAEAFIKLQTLASSITCSILSLVNNV